MFIVYSVLFTAKKKTATTTECNYKWLCQSDLVIQRWLQVNVYRFLFVQRKIISKDVSKCSQQSDNKLEKK